MGSESGGQVDIEGAFCSWETQNSPTVSILRNGFIISLEYFLKVLTKPACLLYQEPPRKEWL